MMQDEPKIIINGQQATVAESMTIRVAVSSMAMSLKSEGLGDDATGKAICAGYLRCINEIFKKMGA